MAPKPTPVNLLEVFVSILMLQIKETVSNITCTDLSLSMTATCTLLYNNTV